MRPARQITFGLLLAALAGPLGASVQAAPSAVDVGPLLRAFTTRVPDLEARAAQGDHDAQFSLSILKAHGLRGVARDAAAAAALRKAALAPGAPRQMTQHIPGLRGAPGRVTVLSLPRDNPVRSTAAQVDRCVETLVRTASARASFFPDFEALRAGSDAGGRDSREAAACADEQRFATLAGLWDRAKPWGERPLPRCPVADHRCRVLRTKVEHLNRRDPAAEAAAAAMRGDFRLGAFNHIGPSPQGWDTSGVACRVWPRGLIGKWHINQDYVSPGDREHTNASVAFLAAYNRALVNHPLFPYADICAEEAVEPLAHYRGPVRSFAEAARSGEVAALATAAAAGADVNARDPFGRTALVWATGRGEEAMARALLERGADPNLYPDDEPAPLALALDHRQGELARLMLARGARMAGQTGLCARPGSIFVDPETAEGPANRKCSWAGLLIAAGDFDLLEQQAAAGALDPPVSRGPQAELWARFSSTPQPRVVDIDPMGELGAAFFEAVKNKDEVVVRRLLPHLGHGGLDASQKAAEALEPLLDAGRPDLVRAYVLGRGAQAARSDAEAEIWRAAAGARQDEALAFLYDFGADLNLLPAARLAQCRAAAAAGAIDRLLACVRDTAERRKALRAAVAAGDFARFDALAAQAADVRERRKQTLVDMAAPHAPASTLRALLARGAPPRTYGFYALTHAYSGRYRADAEALATADQTRPGMPQQPTVVVARRGDAENLRLLVEAGAHNLAAAVSQAGNLGNGPPGMTGFSGPDEDDDSERYPNSPGPEALRAVDLLAAEAARVDGPQSLEAAFASAVYSGYNDVLERLIARGFDPRKANRPEMIWFNWSGLGPCKPSTGLLLLRAGLPTEYPPNDFTHSLPLHGAAAGCRNPRALTAVAPALGVNRLDSQGETALDVALKHNRDKLAAALRALGGRTAKELDPAAVARREQTARATDDLDLVQSEAE